MAASLSNQIQLCYNHIPDSIGRENMLLNFCFDYSNNRDRIMAKRPYVFAQFCLWYLDMSFNEL
jgi:hypothetical protein